MLPKFQTVGDAVGPKDFSLLQTNWASLIDPIIARRQNQSNILVGVPLVVGTNTINHKLGRVLKGWKITRARAFFMGNTQTFYNIYDLQDGSNITVPPTKPNSTPDFTLLLTCDQGTVDAKGNPLNPVLVDIEVF